ncbi:MAG: M20/M25/M40 family metallo-hydrolase, partial [Firmicutes bacterium]|nr:M20/M25/M40 family metallo-hydrolase [Bacillota bacterium]
MKYNHKYEATKGLQPEPFFYWFGEVSACPRPSGNEKALIDYIKNYCEERNLPCDIDEAGNVFVKVPGTAGYEDYPAFLIQGHMDIVPVKDEGVDFDFDKDPYNLQIDGDKIYAPGTTLGADNGVGIATMLAFADTLAEEPVPHPPLELLFTVEEETGMKGIKRFDCSKITARKMINCDSGDPHRVAVCCGGNSKSKIEKEFETEPVGEGWTVLEISLTGGQGGHSGGMINKGRACAANNMGELLTALMADEKVSEFRICSLKTSTPSIIKTCDAIIAVPTADAKAAEDCMNDRFALIKGIYKNSDPDL